jgi:hypothetical protein
MEEQTKKSVVLSTKEKKRNFLNQNMLNLMLFLARNSDKRYTHSALESEGFFSNGTRLYDFLNFAVANGLIKRTIDKKNNREYVFFEIKAEWNDIIKALKVFKI